MKPSPYPNYCKKAVDFNSFYFFLDKFRAYKAIFNVIENHSFFNAKFNFKYPLFKGAKKNQ